MSFGLLAHRLLPFWQSNYLLTLRIPDEGYSMNTWYTLNYIFSSFFVTYFTHYSTCFLVCVCVHPQTNYLFVLLYFVDKENKRQRRLDKMVGML